MNKTALFIICAISLGCSSNRHSADQASIAVCTSDPPSNEFVALVFNTGLGPGLDVSYTTPRIAPVAQAVTAHPWDVLCLDEVWTDAGRNAILSALALPADQVFTADTRGQNEDPGDRCTPGELDDGLACMRSSCANLPDEDVTSCAADHCQVQGFSLYVNHPHCFNCVVASAGKNADQIKQTCEGVGASRMFGGSNGVMLISRRPISNAEWIPLPSSEANRVGLFATVDVGGKPVEVACTHLSGAVDILSPTNLQFSNWYDEMKAQIDIVSDRLAARAKGGPQLLMGDLNTGPSYTGDKKTDAEPVWDEIKNLSFDSPASRTDPSICSRCQGSLIAPTNNRFLIDHVLVRGDNLPTPECAAQAFDAPVVLTDFLGHKVTTNLSDHYGITVQFSTQ